MPWQILCLIAGLVRHSRSQFVWISFAHRWMAINFVISFQLHSEYRSTYRWHEYTGPRQEVVRKPPQATTVEKSNDIHPVRTSDDDFHTESCKYHLERCKLRNSLYFLTKHWRGAWILSWCVISCWLNLYFRLILTNLDWYLYLSKKTGPNCFITLANTSSVVLCSSINISQITH